MRSDYKVYRYDRLDAPVVTAGSAAVLIGAQNGLFPDMGYAVPGEMGGLWAGEKKICDGFFLAVDDVPLTQADACEIHPVVTAFHYRMQKERLHVVRRQFIPDGVSGCVIELTIENLKNAPRMAEVSFTVRTDILTAAAARGEDGAELGRLSSGEQILDISAAGKYLAILTSSSLSIYDQALQEYDVSDNTAGAASVVMRADGSAILLANGHGTLYVP